MDDRYFFHLVGTALGVSAHHLIFIRGEWHVQAPRVFRFYIFCFLTLAVLIHLKSNQEFFDSLSLAFSGIFWHFAGMFGSIVVYRAVFHPLRRFPGPFFAKFSKIWHVWHCRSSNNHLFLDNLRKRYGDFVRTGPNEVTIFHPDGLASINRIEDVRRSQWYDLVHPSFSINTIRDQALHDSRRKVWEHAFTSEAMRDYEQRIRNYALKVETSIRKDTGTIVNMKSIIYRFAYSVMSDLAFGKEADDSDTEWQHTVRTMHKGLSILGPLSPAPWIALFFFSLTWLPLVRDWNSMMRFCRSKMEERVAMSPPPKSRDVAAWLIEDAKRGGRLGTMEEKRWLDGDGFTVILAGSDTTASTLVFAFYYLAKRPEYQHRIREELLHGNGNQDNRGQAKDKYLTGLSFRDFERLPFLNAVINETLRLHHPLPTAGARIVQNPHGINVGGQHIPCGTDVVAPRWSDGRCEAHYDLALEFIPDRWLSGRLHYQGTGKSIVSDRRALTPWAGGRWACLGKPVALFEMRYLIAMLVRNFSISLPEGDNGDAVEREYKDQVTAYPGPLELVYKALD